MLSILSMEIGMLSIISIGWPIPDIVVKRKQSLVKHKEHDSLKSASSSLLSACCTLSSQRKCRENLELSLPHLFVVFLWNTVS